MSTVIRSARVLSEPVTLVHRRSTARPQPRGALEREIEADELQLSETGSSAPASDTWAFHQDAYGAGADREDVSESDGGSASVTETAVEEATPEPRDYLSYEEYKERYEAELAALREEVAEQARQDGERDGRERAEAELSERLVQWDKLLEAARGAVDSGIGDLTDLTVEIVFEAVSKIIGASAPDREGVTSIVREVIRRAKERTKLVVRLSPADHAMLANHRRELLDGFHAESVEIVADDRVELGGCLLETPAGNLDGRLETQMQLLRETLLHARTRQLEQGGDA